MKKIATNITQEQAENLRNVRANVDAFREMVHRTVGLTSPQGQALLTMGNSAAFKAVTDILLGEIPDMNDVATKIASR